MRERTENIGSALQTAFREIEKANPDDAVRHLRQRQWTNKDKLPDRKLADLIEHFSTKTLSNAAVAPDVFGNAYEYLIKRFADQSEQEGRRVLHPALGGRPAGQHPRPAGGRDRLRPGLRHRRHAASRSSST